MSEECVCVPCGSTNYPCSCSCRLSYGNESGLVIVDIVQRTCLLNMGTPDLYGTADPYQRAPKSPKRPDIYEERSPTEQVCVDENKHNQLDNLFFMID